MGIVRGKVVILEFWAEWSEACRSKLQKLKVVHDARDSNGLTVIGLHPPGSPPQLIKKVIDELHLDFPTSSTCRPSSELSLGVICLADLLFEPCRTPWPWIAWAGSSACGALEDVLAPRRAS